MRTISKASLTAACAALMLLTACAGEPPAPPLLVTDGQNQAESYKLGLGDKVRIQVFGETDLSGEFQVSGAGTVSMPLIGDVQAVGLTARQLEAGLVQRYGAGYLRNPKIAVEVFDFRPYFILGEVEKPGRYPSLEGTTVLNAVATAGGFTYRADKKRIFIRRSGDAIEREASLSSTLVVHPGDVLRVGERHF